MELDNSTCKRVLDPLKPSDLTLGQVVIKRVAVVELGVNNGSGDGGGCFGINRWHWRHYVFKVRARIRAHKFIRKFMDEIVSERI